MSDVSIILGKRIRLLRTERGLSQEELAFSASISAAHLGQIERALKKPTIETLNKLATALGVSITDLFTDSVPDSAIQANPTINKINAQLANMSEDEQRDILKVIRIFKGFRSNDE